MRTKQFGRRAMRAILIPALMTGFSVTAFAENPDPVAVLQQMSKTIAGLDTFVVSGDSYADARLPEGHIVEQASEVTARVMRPNRIRLTNKSAVDTKEIYIVDGVLTVLTQPRNFYAQKNVPTGIEAGVTFAIEELDIDAPVLDLLSKDVVSNLTGDATSVIYLSESLVRGRMFHHIAIRGPEIDLQVWVPVTGPALPGKIAMTSKWEGGAPRFVAFFEWDLDPDIPAGTLKFRPPDGAVQVEFLDAGEG